MIIQKFNNDQSLVRQIETLLRLHNREISIETLQTVPDDQTEDEMVIILNLKLILLYYSPR